MSIKCVPDILRNGNTADGFKQAAEELRELADKVESGTVLAMKWVVIEREKDGPVIWFSNHFKARGVSAMEMYGTLSLAAAEYAKEHLQEE